MSLIKKYKLFRFYALLVLLVLGTKTLLAQFKETIQSDRPCQAYSAFTVGENVWQFQQGVEYNSSINTRNPVHTYLNNNVIRYGLLDKLEINSVIDYQTNKQNISGNDIKQNGLSSLHFGLRMHILDQKRLLPNTSIQTKLKLHNISKSYGQKYIANEISLINNWALPNNYSLSTISTLSYPGDKSGASFLYVVNLGVPLSSKTIFYIENYGSIKDGLVTSKFDAGLTYLPNNNIQIDIASGLGINTKAYYCNAGISWRIVPLNNKSKNTKKHE